MDDISATLNVKADGFDDVNRDPYFAFLENAGLGPRGEKTVTAGLIRSIFATCPIDASQPFSVIDAGVGDGTVLLLSLDGIIDRLRPLNVPLRIVLKEFSGKDVLVVSKKIGALFEKYPLTSVTFTNLPFTNAPWLDFSVAKPTAWKPFALDGRDSPEEQVQVFEPFVKANYGTILNSKKRPVPEKAVGLTLYPAGMEDDLAGVIPQLGVKLSTGHDVAIVSHTYAAGASLALKADTVRPLAQSLKEGGQLFGIHWEGADDCETVNRQAFPSFHSGRHSAQQIFDAVVSGLTGNERDAIKFMSRQLPTYDFNMPAGEITARTVRNVADSMIYAGQVFPKIVADSDTARSLAIVSKFLEKNNRPTFRNEAYIFQRQPG